jgi:3-oxoacyl-[acyl-carrier protein] reductase
MGARLDGKIALLIGGAAGIGKGIASRLLADGANLMLGDIDLAGAMSLASSLGLPEAQVMRADASREEDVAALVARACAVFGHVDILVQNAGIYPFSLIVDTSVAQWEHVQAVNLRSVFLAARACAPGMIARGYGRMVFTSSITGPRVVSHGLASYAASKAGINGFVKAAAIEFAALGITVNAVEPGNILTEGLQAGRSAQFIAGMERSVPMNRLGTPGDVAGAVSFLASDDAAYITGTSIVVDGGQTLPESKDFQDSTSWH